MPFKHPMRPYTRENIEGIKNQDQIGVYGLFKDNNPIYIGSGNIRGRLLAHINGDNPCIDKNSPNLWTAEVFAGDPAPREVHLLREYHPICNKIISW